MLPKVVCAAFALFICVGIILADEMKGKVEKVDAEKGVVTVKVAGKEKPANIKVGKDTKLVGADGKALTGVKDIKEGSDVTVTYEKKDKKTTIQSIKIDK